MPLIRPDLIRWDRKVKKVKGFMENKFEKIKKYEFNNIIEFAKNARDISSVLKIIIKAVQKNSDFECVAIRIKNEIGDYPYFTYFGFSDEFVRTENSLCSQDENGKIERDFLGNPVLECMCGNIIQGRFDPALPFFTKKGSFWSNSTTKLLASTDEKDRQSRTRNRCNGEGYESVGLFALKFGEMTIGLLQFNDHRKNMFSDENIKEFESFADQLSEVIYYSIIVKGKKE